MGSDPHQTFQEGLLPSNDEVINGMDHLTPNPSNHSNLNEDRFSRISQNVDSQLHTQLNGASDGGNKMAKTDLKARYNNNSKAAQILSTSPYNSANQSD